jgi:hypothetical protein
MKDSDPICDLYILSAVTDISFVEKILSHQLKQCKVNGSKFLRVDTSKVSGYYKNNRDNQPIEKLLQIAAKFKESKQIDEIIKIEYDKDIKNVSYLKHFGKKWVPTHCFRGYPYYGSILPFEHSKADYIAHLDSDMLIYQEEGFDWIEYSIKLMESNPEIVCCLPLSGPPTENGVLFQGSTEYQKDNLREIFLFKNFTSRIFVMNVKRFLSLCPMKVAWLSWREPFYSQILGQGKMLCWEVTVSNALEKSSLYRADLSTHRCWSLHPYERSSRFLDYLPYLIESVENGHFPIQQAGHYDLNLDWWVDFKNKN